jgi:hypothetical protein
MGRAPHIHAAISKNGHRLLTTQALMRGHEANLHDGVFREIHDERARETVLTDFKPIPGSKLGELAANFDVIFNRTAQEGDDGKLTGGIGNPKAAAPADADLASARRHPSEHDSAANATILPQLGKAISTRSRELYSLLQPNRREH